MFGSRERRTEDVTCIACGDEVSRDRAREYDKHGDRWDRRDKEFEFLCKPCHGDLCHQPRQGLEEQLVSIGAGACDRETFIAAFVDADRSRASEADER